MTVEIVEKGSAILKRAYRVAYLDTGEGPQFYRGEVYDDDKERFRDGDWITTSQVVGEDVLEKEVHTKIVETLNTTYYIDTDASHLREAAWLILRTGVARGVHCKKTHQGDTYCINGTLFATDPDPDRWKLEVMWDDEPTELNFHPARPDDRSHISHPNDRIQSAIVGAISQLYPDDHGQGSPWTWNDCLSKDNEGKLKVNRVLNRAADILEGLV